MELGMDISEILFLIDKVLCAVNDGGDHWVLVIVEPEQKKFVYINLLGELLTSCQKILHYWCQIVQEWHRLLGIRYLLGDRTIEKKRTTVSNYIETRVVCLRLSLRSCI